MSTREFRIRPGQEVTLREDDIVRLTLEDGIISFTKLSSNRLMLTRVHTEEIL